jgi:signal peptidase I
VARRSFLHDYFQAAIIAVMIALFVRTYLVQAFQIPSPSMLNSIMVGDHILVNKFAYGPTASPLERAVLPYCTIARGDIIIFKFPNEPEKDYVKRVIGLPGETLRIENQQVMIKKPGESDYSTLKEEDYVFHSESVSAPDPDHLNNREPYEIKPHHYYVMGDNREDSRDSRDWDTVPEEYIRGKALMVYWSVDPLPPPSGDRASAPGPLQTFWETVTATFTRTRWKRTFYLIH